MTRTLAHRNFEQPLASFGLGYLDPSHLLQRVSLSLDLRRQRRPVLAPMLSAHPSSQSSGPGELAFGAPRARLLAQEVLMGSALVKRDPEIMSGALCFTGTRVPVKNLFDYLEGSSSLEDFLEDFPTVSRERAVAVLEAARASLAADAPAA